MQVQQQVIEINETSKLIAGKNLYEQISHAFSREPAHHLIISASKFTLQESNRPNLHHSKCNQYHRIVRKDPLKGHICYLKEPGSCKT